MFITLFITLQLVTALFTACGSDGSIVFSIIAKFLRATAGTAIARLSHRNSVRPSVCHTGGKNGAS